MSGVRGVKLDCSHGQLLWCAKKVLLWPAAIGNQQLCTQAGGQWTSARCSVTSQPACTEHGGSWAPAPMWTLKGGVDLLIVGLLQALSLSLVLPPLACCSCHGATAAIHLWLRMPDLSRLD